MAAAAAFLILVGGYGNAITSLKFTPSTSSLTYMTQTNVAQMTTWLSTHPANSSIVYAAQEAWYTTGNIFSLILNPTTGALTTKSSISTGPMVSNYGGGCVHVTPINGGTALAAANFNSGSAFVVPLNSDRLTFGSGQVLQFTGSGPMQNQKSAHAHQAIEYGNEVIVADLGSDFVRRLTKNGNTWYEAAKIQFPAGSGPRHMVAMNNTLYTLHQNYNALSQSTLPALGSGGISQVVANFTIVPPGTSNTSGMSAAELLWAPSVTCGASPLLYASNRDDPSQNDAIAIFETTPALKPVAHVRTGLKHVRGMEFVGANKEYIVAGGMSGGGIKVFKRVSAAEGYLTQVAAFNSGQIVQPTGFTWIKV
ncbi:hypothetical protein PIIN_02069 [Serendipita indica DSM 11827]|uniref:6-phosphogluconolactonase n=1 Tax=Serendipita indica (strain DSM 11827) TaxID=1109443 RepID=G4TA95_SERID|nr:hypothetical protein PIIN_02069 [Serendipita indica DSM 11827]